jgi:SAM-dependent methyltransferase
MIDWGVGEYERTARELEPVAEHAVALADVQAGERVLDLATGTGNAALLAAGRGAGATGIDASPRLIDVARARAAAAGLEVAFAVGDVQALAFEDAGFDVVLSVFGLIFAADPARAFDEMMRVLRRGGRAVVAVWIPSGPIDAMVGVFARAVAQAVGAAPPRFPWHDDDAVRELAARHAAKLRFHRGELEITAPSPEAYLAAGRRHPMSLSAQPILERAGTAQATAERALAALREGNEDPAGFRVRSPYKLIEIQAD